MSSLKKLKKEESMDLKINKALDELNLKARKLTNKFNSLIDLEIIIEEIEKIHNNKRLGIKKAKSILKKILEEFKTKDRRVRMGIKIFNIKMQIFLSI